MNSVQLHLPLNLSCPSVAWLSEAIPASVGFSEGRDSSLLLLSPAHTFLKSNQWRYKPCAKLHRLLHANGVVSTEALKLFVFMYVSCVCVLFVHIYIYFF